MHPRFASFTVPHPELSVSFLTKYLGGTRLTHEEYIAFTHAELNVHVEAARFANYDVYFWYDKQALPRGAAASFANLVESSHSMVQDDWDWWQDWHIAFRTKNLDAVALRLMKDGIPFVSRNSGIYFTVPGGITIQVNGRFKTFWTEPFLFCRRTTNEIASVMAPYPLNTTDFATAPLPVLLEMYVTHHSFAVSNASKNMEWVMRNFPVEDVSVNFDFSKYHHQFSGGTCADLKWVYFKPVRRFDFHFVEQFRKREGNANLRQQEIKLQELRQDGISNLDAFYGTRTGFSVPDLRPFINHFQSMHEWHRVRHQRLVVLMPCGYLVEIFASPAASAIQHEVFEIGTFEMASFDSFQVIMCMYAMMIMHRGYGFRKVLM